MIGSAPPPTDTVARALLEIEPNIAFGHPGLMTFARLLAFQPFLPVAIVVTVIALGAMTLVLGIVSLYSTVFYSVSQGRHEMGIRVALGAQPRDLFLIRYANGDAAIQIDCDLEDPPSLFHEFVRLWRAGHDVVVGIRTQRHERAYMVLARRAFYRILDSISEVHHQTDAGDFRLVDRRILAQLRRISDVQPYVRGLISELARNQVGVSYARCTRKFRA